MLEHLCGDLGNGEPGPGPQDPGIDPDKLVQTLFVLLNHIAVGISAQDQDLSVEDDPCAVAPGQTVAIPDQHLDLVLQGVDAAEQGATDC